MPARVRQIELMVCRRAALGLAVFLASPGVSAGQAKITHGTVPVLQSVRASSPVVIDGLLDDEVWVRTPATTGFTQRDPDEGKPATERTELRIAYDNDALYIAARMDDNDAARIARQLARRDQDAEADMFVVYLDPHHDHVTGAVFGVSAAGVQSDAVVFNDTWRDQSWDAVWTSAV
jgi:hypothetical protein